MTVASSQSALEIKNLAVEFRMASGTVRAVDDVSYSVAAGETLAVVGETGSGKSVTALAALGLSAGTVVGGSVRIDGTDFLALNDRQRRAILGGRVAIIFQDPSSALNPVMTVGDQISESIRVHNRNLSAREVRSRAIALLSSVGVPQPELRYGQFPHQFSGGMAQRVVIAMAIANRPAVLFADEPTTAVDVTIQAQLLDLLDQAKRETGAAVVLITHDLGVVAETADNIAVMYAGRVVESGDVNTVFAHPRHPYTLGLLASMPRLDTEHEYLEFIPGTPPDMRRLPPGCAFESRCKHAKGRAACRETKPPLSAAGSGKHLSACHFWEEL